MNRHQRFIHSVGGFKKPIYRYTNQAVPPELQGVLHQQRQPAPRLLEDPDGAGEQTHHHQRARAPLHLHHLRAGRHRHGARAPVRARQGQDSARG